MNCTKCKAGYSLIYNNFAIGTCKSNCTSGGIVDIISTQESKNLVCKVCDISCAECFDIGPLKCA